ncbi:hypothetical protein Daus18300_007021 [Diaporthe australafricana]|uniref:Uncharacterized protein n=1 Tax=Diaporthe australafricana TaxID=127596 RepID=A0ABR3WQS3_9PEZI
MNNAERSKKLRNIIKKTAPEIFEALKPLNERYDRLRFQILHYDDVAKNFPRLADAEALIENQLVVLASKKDLVEATASMCEPEGNILYLLTILRGIIAELQSDAHIKKQNLQEWGDIYSAMQSLEDHKEEVQREDLTLREQIRVVRDKEAGQEDRLQIA